MMIRRAKTGIVALVLIGAQAPLIPALAQDGTVQLEGIVISTVRAERSLENVPASVQVITQDQIARQLSVSSDPTDAIAKLIPGFSVSNQTVSGASESFRGRNTLILVDGVPRTTPLRDSSRILSLIDLNNVERIEVLNGSSSLYGSGASGGTINFITKRGKEGKPAISITSRLSAFTANVGDSLMPSTSASISGKSGKWDYYGGVTGQFTDRTYDGSGRELPSDSLIGQGGLDRSDYVNGRVKLGYETGPQRFELGAEWTYWNQSPDYLTNYDVSPVRPDFGARYPGEDVQEDSKYLSFVYSNTDFALGKLDVKAFYNDMEKRYAFSEISIANPFVYFSGNPADPYSENQTTQDSKRTGVNLTIDSPLDAVYTGARLTWGADYNYEKVRQYFLDDVAAIAPMQQHSYAAFGQLDVPVTTWFNLRGGVRYEKFKLSVDDFTRPAYVVDIPTVYGLPLPPAAVAGLCGPLYLGGTECVFQPANVIGGDSEYDAVTFNIGGTVDLSRNIQFFGGFSQGYELPDVGAFTRRAGQSNPLGGTLDFSNIAPEAQKVNNYEIGLRGKWDRFSGTISGFLSTSDQGVTFDAATNSVAQQREEIYGVEFTGDAKLTDKLMAGVVLSYREGKYDTDDDGDVDTYLPNNRIASPFRGLAYVSYTFDNGLYLRGEVEYFSERDHEDTGSQREYDIEDAWTFNVLGQYELAGGTLMFSARNLFDATYENPTATATRNIPVNAFGRTVSVGYKIDF